MNLTKLVRSTFSAVFCLAALAGSAFAQGVSWNIDGAHSSAQFAVKHLMVSTVRGQFGPVKGTIVYDAKDVSKSKVDAKVDVATVDTRDPKRDAHLKSPDFFDAEKFPAMSFVSTKVAKSGAKLMVSGDLTIRGVSKPVTFEVDGPAPEVKMGETYRSGVTATAKINRKDFGINWNRTMDTGGVVVSDEVAITIEMELTRK